MDLVLPPSLQGLAIIDDHLPGGLGICDGAEGVGDLTGNPPCQQCLQLEETGCPQHLLGNLQGILELGPPCRFGLLNHVDPLPDPDAHEDLHRFHSLTLVPCDHVVSGG